MSPMLPALILLCARMLPSLTFHALPIGRLSLDQLQSLRGHFQDHRLDDQVRRLFGLQDPIIAFFASEAHGVQMDFNLNADMYIVLAPSLSFSSSRARPNQ